MAFDGERASGGLPGGIGLSIGIAPVAGDAASLMDAIREADSRMYQDKLREHTAEKPA